MIPKRTPSPPVDHPRTPLPSGHFLALPPSYAQPSGSITSPSTSSHTSHGLAPNVASLASADFEVDVKTGFLPRTKNVERLLSAWEIWEEALDAARGSGSADDNLRLGGGRERDALWRSGIEMVSWLGSWPPIAAHKV